MAVAAVVSLYLQLVLGWTANMRRPCRGLRLTHHDYVTVEPLTTIRAGCLVTLR